MCISAYLFITVLFLLLPCITILFLHLLSTNHKCTQPCHFSLLLKSAVQKERMDWNSSTRSFRLRVVLVVVSVVLWSLPLFCSTMSCHSFKRHYLYNNNYTLFMIFNYL
jgi:ABC-type spermidine/putrescine transport system permease subunit II